MKLAAPVPLFHKSDNKILCQYIKFRLLLNSSKSLVMMLLMKSKHA